MNEARRKEMAKLRDAYQMLLKQAFDANEAWDREALQKAQHEMSLNLMKRMNIEWAQLLEDMGVK